MFIPAPEMLSYMYTKIKINHRAQPCQNVLAASNFAPFSQLLAAYSILDFTRRPLAGKGTWCLLPTTPSMLSTATKHFDRAVCYPENIIFKTLIRERGLMGGGGGGGRHKLFQIMTFPFQLKLVLQTFTQLRQTGGNRLFYKYRIIYTLRLTTVTVHLY